METPEALAVKAMSDFNPPHECGDERCCGLFLDFLLTVVLPSGVGLMLAFSLAMCMCCSGSRRKRKLESDEEQYSRYDSVRRASMSLRQMSHKRDTPLMDDRCMTLDRDHRHRRGFRPRDSCQSAPGTLQRQHRQRAHSDSLPPPPAYGPPPQYPINEDDPFVDADIPMHEMAGRHGSMGHGHVNQAASTYDYDRIGHYSTMPVGHH